MTAAASSVANPATVTDGLRIGVVIATLGRSEESTHVLRCLLAQTLPPAAIVFSVEKASDLPRELPPSVQYVTGPRGLCAQRNRGVAAICDKCDVIVFFDDDYVPSRHALDGVRRLFESRAEIVGATGLVLADGVGHGGIAADRADAIVAQYDGAPRTGAAVTGETRAAYGCNMAFRVSAMRQVAFDERLPLYGWQEDVDYTGQIARFGRVVNTDAFAGVHRGVTTGRTPGARLGYAQIVNPVYLARKGTMTWGHAIRIMIRNLLANHVRMLTPEPHVDRAGRTRGNWIGLGHLLTGRIEPEYMLKL